MASPFQEPVDWQRLNIPSYPKIVKKPMDLSTMQTNLEEGKYANAQQFADDFSLMIKNCTLFNPVGTQVRVLGDELHRWFNDRWESLPPLKSVSDDDEEEDDEDSDEDRVRTIASLESQIETMKGNLALLKNATKKKEKKKKEKKRASSPVASSSKPNGKAAKHSSGKKKSTKKTDKFYNSDVLSFEQKKDLSETIQSLDGEKLERVIQIIHDGVPEVRDSTEEIELDIDQLPGPVLQKLYNFVILPLRQTAPKRKRTGTGTGTGGLKRKSMDEDVEAEKIRQLEERMRMFDNKAPPTKRNDSVHSSDESSSESSASEDSD